MQMKASYIPFYLEGRADEQDDPVIADDDAFDLEKLAEKALAGGPDLREIVVAAVTAFAAPMQHGTDKRDWIADHKAEIKDAGGDEGEAYGHYLKGVIDEAAHQLESDVLEEMDGDVEEDEEDEEEED